MRALLDSPPFRLAAALSEVPQPLLATSQRKGQVIHRLERWTATILLLLALFAGAMLSLILDAALPRQHLRKDS